MVRVRVRDYIEQRFPGLKVTAKCINKQNIDLNNNNSNHMTKEMSLMFNINTIKQKIHVIISLGICQQVN